MELVFTLVLVVPVLALAIAAWRRGWRVVAVGLAALGALSSAMGVGTAPAKGPFVFTFPMGEARGGDERVTIELRDGTRVEGRLLDFGERAGVLT